MDGNGEGLLGLGVPGGTSWTDGPARTPVARAGEAVSPPRAAAARNGDEIRVTIDGFEPCRQPFGI